MTMVLELHIEFKDVNTWLCVKGDAKLFRSMNMVMRLFHTQNYGMNIISSIYAVVSRSRYTACGG